VPDRRQLIQQTERDTQGIDAKVVSYDPDSRVATVTTGRLQHMEKKDVLTKVLAVAGTALVWFPILAPVLLSVVVIITRRLFRFDYLMPAELFPVALAGGGLLVWAARRARARQKLIGWGLGMAAGFLAGGQVLAVVTGLASGATEPTGWPWMLVLASLVIYSLALVAMGVGGVLLLRER
jgi:hypothetical protein